MNSGVSTDVVVVGCGIIGASIAWRLARAGLTVRCVDPAPGDGATHAAAGMLAAVTESTFGEHDLMRLNVESGAMWPAFAAELEAETGVATGFRTVGTLTVAFDSGDRQQLHRLLHLQREWGLEAEAIDVAEARRMEPSLGPRIAGAAWVPGDHHVNPRAIQRGLLAALDARGVDVVRRRVVRLAWRHGTVTGVIDDTGAEHNAGAVVVAAGWNSRAVALEGGPSERQAWARVPTRPVKGQVIRLGAALQPTFRLHRVIRGFVQARAVYLVPRDDGEIVVGATSEEQPDDRIVTAGGLFALLRDARALVPGIDELPVTDTTARARPGSPDNLPLIGHAAIPGVVIATGHYRNGILLTPLTAASVVSYCTGAEIPHAVLAADPGRFRRAVPDDQVTEVTAR